MARALINQELKFNGNASDANLVAYFPPSCLGQYVEFTVYVEYASGSSAGKVQIQTAYTPLAGGEPNRAAIFTGTWANVGSTIDYAATAPIVKYASVTGVFSDLRLIIDTAVTSGSVKAYVVAASHAG